MAKKEEILKTIIVFLFFLFGCSSKYVDDGGRSLDEKVVASWEVLDCMVVEQDEHGFSMGLEVRNIIVVGDSLKSGELYKGKSLKKSDLPLLGAMIALGGCLGGVGYGLSDFSLHDYDKEKYDRSCLISFTSCLAGAGLMFVSLPNSGKRKVIKAIPDFIKKDTICVDSVLLSRQKIKISVEKTDFEEIYWSDENGNVEFKFDEMIPEPTEVDSILNLIIQYEEMVDTVKVERL